MSTLIPLAAGFIAGAAASAGLGGGFVLMIYLTYTGMSAADAKAVNLLFFIPVALVSMLINRRRGSADSEVIPFAAAAGSIGAVIGLMLTEHIDTGILRMIFSALLIAVGIRELFHRKKEKRTRPDGRRLRPTA
ncbi:MAG: sulfite exporter TauE/SafE family protein [Ruminiclostridium sp.]|nr:sulfite exporter TauE/SafE family protein [Ruminiclostridium sp.]